MLTQDPILAQAFEKQQRARILKEAEQARLLRKLATQDTQIEIKPLRKPKYSLKGLSQISARLSHALKDLFRPPHTAEG